MFDLSSFGAALAVYVIGTASPGPGNLAIANTSLNFGRTPGLALGGDQFLEGHRHTVEGAVGLAFVPAFGGGLGLLTHLLRVEGVERIDLRLPAVDVGQELVVIVDGSELPAGESGQQFGGRKGVQVTHHSLPWNGPAGCNGGDYIHPAVHRPTPVQQKRWGISVQTFVFWRRERRRGFARLLASVGCQQFKPLLCRYRQLCVFAPDYDELPLQFGAFERDDFHTWRDMVLSQ